MRRIVQFVFAMGRLLAGLLPSAAFAEANGSEGRCLEYEGIAAIDLPDQRQARPFATRLLVTYCTDRTRPPAASESEGL